MPHPANTVPTYALHKPSGQVSVRLPDGAGRRIVYLGRAVPPESRAEYRRILAELPARTAGLVHLPPRPNPHDVTVYEVLLAFLT